MGKFRIKTGDREIEYEGEDSEVKYKDALEWLKSTGRVTSVEGETGQQEPSTKGKRGGARQAIFAPPLKKMVKEGFFKLPNRRTTPEVLKGLEDRAIPVSGKDTAIINACKRLVKNGTLKGTKTDSGWQFWQE